MGKPAARVGDFHMCPMVTPAVPPIPHVGGPILPPGKPTVLIGGMPAATMGNMCLCTGPPDSIILGSTGVMIGGQPAARMGDMCAHGGAIMAGCPTVLIGEICPPGMIPPPVVTPGVMGAPAAPPDLMKKVGAGQLKDMMNEATLKNAAAAGSETAERTDKEDFSAEFTLLDEAGKGVSGTAYEIEKPDGSVASGKTDSSGKTANLSGFTVGECRITFLNKH